MLGKTNLTMVEGGVIVSDIEDYGWNAVNINGVTGTFVKAIYENNMLVAITKDGTIVYTEDGENWKSVRLDLEENYKLNDIIWDGSRYIMVGSVRYEYNDSEWIDKGIIVTSENLVEFVIKKNETDVYSSYFAVLEKDGKYIVVGAVGTSYTHMIIRIKSFIGNLDGLNVWDSQYEITSGDTYSPKNDTNNVIVQVAKKSNEFIIYIKLYYYSSSSSSSYAHNIYVTSNGTEFRLKKFSSEKVEQYFSVFECKDNLYYYENISPYEFNKIIGTSENAVISTNINYAFVDAVYFNKCEIYINEHQMLIVKQGERITEKSLDDLKDITYDFSMTYILKAFDKLYVFGTGGNVLASSDEIKSEESLAVKTMSAAKALYDANKYTDQKFAELEARVATLEANMGE